MAVVPTSSLPASGSIVSRWYLDESGSGNRADSVGSNTLTATTMAADTGYSNTGASYANSAKFVRASSAKLQIADGTQSGLDLSGSFTISTFVKFASAPASFMAVVNKWKESSGNRAYRITALGTDQSITFSMSSGGDAGTQHDCTSAGSFWTTGTWVHIVAVFNPSTSLVLYKNGISNTTNSSSIPATVKNSSESFSLGTEPENGYYLDGDMQDTIIWSTNLSGSQVTALENLYTTAGAQGGFLLNFV